MTSRAARVLHASVLLASVLLATVLPVTAPAALSEPLPIEARPIETLPLDSDEGVSAPLSLLAAFELVSPHPRFGGLSGAAINGDRLVAVTDKGDWVAFTLDSDGAGRVLSVLDATIEPMRVLAAAEHETRTTDAESLCLTSDGLLVAFEGRHRLGLFADRKAAEQSAPLPRLRRGLQSNKGVEALACADDGTVFAIAERGVRQARDNFGWRIRNGRATAFRFPRTEGFSPTGADFGPDGALYLLERRFTLPGGVWMRLRRFRHPLREGALGAGEVLAVLGPESGVDNMEAIIAEPGPDGAILLTVLSDDNFNSFQSTVLLQFAYRPED